MHVVIIILKKKILIICNTFITIIYHTEHKTMEAKERYANTEIS